jgi:hypothetical protein
MIVFVSLIIAGVENGVLHSEEQQMVVEIVLMDGGILV